MLKTLIKITIFVLVNFFQYHASASEAIVVSSGGFKTVNLDTQTTLASYTPSAIFEAHAFSPDGQTIYMINTFGVVRARNVRTGQSLGSITFNVPSGPLFIRDAQVYDILGTDVLVVRISGKIYWGSLQAGELGNVDPTFGVFVTYISPGIYYDPVSDVWITFTQASNTSGGWWKLVRIHRTLQTVTYENIGIQTNSLISDGDHLQVTQPWPSVDNALFTMYGSDNGYLSTGVISYFPSLGISARIKLPAVSTDAQDLVAYGDLAVLVTGQNLWIYQPSTFQWFPYPIQTTQVAGLKNIALTGNSAWIHYGNANLLRVDMYQGEQSISQSQISMIKDVSPAQASSQGILILADQSGPSKTANWIKCLNPSCTQTQNKSMTFSLTGEPFEITALK